MQARSGGPGGGNQRRRRRLLSLTATPRRPTPKSVHKFWAERARLGNVAGTNDILLKQLEMEQLLSTVPHGSRVLDVGCGNGDTLVRLARELSCEGVGVDYTRGMVALAEEAARKAGVADRVAFRQGRVPGLPINSEGFDCALTERCLINLSSPEEQKRAFDDIIRNVRPGGTYLMIESFADGLERINEVRTPLGLPRIDPPWHNRFLSEAATKAWGSSSVRLERIVPFSSTYYFMSRVVYAKLAADRGEPLRYDSDINVLSCRLPVLGDYGPVRMWQWRRIA